MISQTLRDLLRSQESLLKIIWLVCTLSIFVYIGVAYFLSLQGANTGGHSATSGQLQTIFAVLALLTALLPFLIKRLMLNENSIKKSVSREITDKELATNSQTGQVDQKKLAQVKMLSELEKKLLVISQSYFSPALISLVFNETIAIFGLVLSLITGQFEPVIPFALAAILLNFIHFPRLGAFVERISESRIIT